MIDFRRDILDMPATVLAIEYDPNRTARLALVVLFQNGEKRYILALERVEGRRQDRRFRIPRRPTTFYRR